MEAGLGSEMAHGELSCARLCCTNQKKYLGILLYLRIYMNFVTANK